MTESSREFRIGIFALIALGLLCGLILMYRDEPSWFWANRWDLTIHVNSPTGIQEGTPAYLQGVQVGRVRQIGFKDVARPSAGAAVIVEVEDHYDVPVGTVATLHPSFGFDKGAINLRPPAQETPAVDRDHNAIIGNSVGPLETIVPPEFVATLVAAVQEIGDVSQRVKTVAEDLHGLLEMRTIAQVDGGDPAVTANFYTAVQRFDGTLQRVDRLLGDDDAGDLPQAVANLRQISEDLRLWTGALDSRTTATLERIDATLAEVTARFNSAGEQLAGRLDELSTLLDTAQRVMAHVERGEGTAGLLVRDARLYEELVASVENVRGLVDDLKALAMWIRTDSWLKRGF